MSKLWCIHHPDMASSMAVIGRFCADSIRILQSCTDTLYETREWITNNFCCWLLIFILFLFVECRCAAIKPYLRTSCFASLHALQIFGTMQLPNSLPLLCRLWCMVVQWMLYPLEPVTRPGSSALVFTSLIVFIISLPSSIFQKEALFLF